MAQILLNLPTDIAVDIISNWIGAADSVKLDTAFCDSITRPKFVNILSRCNLRQPQQRRINTDSLVRWSLKRSNRVDLLYINEASDLSLYEAFLTSCGSAVSKIRLERRARSDVLSTTKLMSLVAAHCLQLKILDWNGAGEGLDIALRDVLSRCTLLQELRVSASIYNGFTSQSLEGIQCPQLRTLSMHCFYSAEITAAFIKAAPNLDTLTIQMFRSQREDGTIALQHINPSIRNLEITDSQIKDDELIYLVNLCPRLVSINLSDTGMQGTVLTVRSIEYMAQRLTSLTKVNLSSNLSEDCLLALVRHRAQTLTSLDIVQCYRLHVASINAALRQCTKLTRLGTHLDQNVYYLDFSLLCNMTDLHFVVDTNGQCANCLTQIAENCPKLQHLLLDVLEELESADELDVIVQNCVDIRTLKIRAEEFDCGGFVDQEKLNEWKLLRPQLVVVDGPIYD